MDERWTEHQLNAIGEAEELQLASLRPDGSLRPYGTMWVVRVGDDLYVRSANGPNNPWYRRARASGRGRVRAGLAPGAPWKWRPRMCWNLSGPGRSGATSPRQLGEEKACRRT